MSYLLTEENNIDSRNHTEKDCECIIHAGPHYLHVDKLWRDNNQQFLERLKQAVEQNNYSDAILAKEAFLREELARLKEKEHQMVAYQRWMRLRDTNRKKLYANS